VRGHLAGGRPASGQRQHDLVDAIQPTLTLAHDPRIEAAVAVPRHLDLHRSDLMPLRELPPSRPAGSCFS
jgi:hypothetical protein